MQLTKPERSILTVAQLTSKHPAFSSGGLRWLIFNSESRYAAGGTVIPGNGLSEALIRVGRRVLIDEAKFFDWLDRQNTRDAARGSGVALTTAAVRV